MVAERWNRMYQILSTIEMMNYENQNTTVKKITEYIKEIEEEITINIINSSIRRYYKNGLLKKKYNPHMRPFEYILSKRGYEQLEWLEDEEYLEYLY